jgi:hypothetical protein
LIRNSEEGTNQRTIARSLQPVLVSANFGRLFSCVADAAQTIVDFDRVGIELVAIAEASTWRTLMAGRWRRWRACSPSWSGT